MPGEQALIIALRAAVEAAPDLEAVRLQLADALLRAGESEEALLHARTVLARRPDSSPALNCAQQAAEALGEDELAASFARLLGALQDSAGPPRLTVEAVEEDVDQHPVVQVDGPTTRLADVGGMQDAKRRLELAFLGPMRNPQLRELYGAELRGGLMLWGPPGCGKTLLARAVAGEMGASFVSVGLEDVLDMWLGQSEKRLHDLFAQARRLAPCVLFFDEIDALGQKRGQLRNSAGRNIVNQLLSEMDGLRSGENDGVFVLGATNHPWDVDSALRRPGRFDRAVLVLPPDLEARTAILELHLRDRPTEGVDLGDLAKRTDGFSGADLALVCRSAAANAMAEAVDTGRSRPISQRDLRAAVADVSPSTQAWFKLAFNYAAFSGEPGYEDLLAHIKRHRLA